MDAPASSTATPATARAELESVLAATAFAGAQAHQRLLRYLLEHSLAGNAQMLKETVLGIEVFRRPPGRFDPRSDSIVRVEARRLRHRLERHYADAAAAGGDWMLVLPKGSYRLQCVRRPDAVEQPQAAELVERGHHFLRQGHDAGHRKALERFETAARAAPDLAAAHSGVARAWLQLVATNIEPPRPGIDLALAAVRRALALQPSQPDALVLAAQLTHRFEFDWTEAAALYDRAAAAAPASAYVHQTRALSLMTRGDFDGAAAALALARRLDPLHLGVRAHLGLLHVYRRRWDEAEAALHGLLDMHADNVLGMSLLAYTALCRGDAAGALAQYRTVAERHPRLSIGLTGQAQALAALGRRAAARQVLRALWEHWSGRYLSPYQLAMAEHQLGDAGAALALLERAVAERDPNALCLPVDPAFDALRQEPRGAALVRRVLGTATEVAAVAAPGAALRPAPAAAAVSAPTP